MPHPIYGDTLYDVNYDEVKGVKVHISYELIIHLTPLFENVQDKLEPAVYSDYGKVTISDPEVAIQLIKYANDNNYTPFNVLLNDYLIKLGTDLVSFMESYNYEDTPYITNRNDIRQIIERDIKIVRG